MWKAFHHTGLQNTWKNKDVCVYRKYPKLSGCSQSPGDEHGWWVPWCRCTTHYVKHPSWLKDYRHPCLHTTAVINSVIHRRQKCHADKATKIRWNENWFQDFFCRAVGKWDSLFLSINYSHHQTHVSEVLLQDLIDFETPHSLTHFPSLSSSVTSHL